MKAIAGWIGNIIGIAIGVSLAGNLMLIILSHTPLIHIEQKMPVEKIVYVTVTNTVYQGWIYSTNCEPWVFRFEANYLDNMTPEQSKKVLEMMPTDPNMPKYP